MSSNQVNVKALDDYPDLLEIELFYKDMFLTCQTDFTKIAKYCEIHDMSKDEIIEASLILNNISTKVK